MIKHEGLHPRRLSRESVEDRLAKAWAEEAPRTLPYLLHGQDRNDHIDLTQAEATVAATVIQWLGSPIGQAFLDDAGFQVKKEAK